MIEIEKPNITTVNLNEDGTHGRFVVEKKKKAVVILLYGFLS